MPDIKPLSILAKGFNEFFYIKIAKIMDKLKLNVSTHNHNKCIEDEYQTEKRIGILMPVSHMDVINMVKSVPPKSCELNPIPMKILKEHIDALAYGIANIINTSFKHGYMCDSLNRCNFKTIIKVVQTGPCISKFQTCLKPSISRQTSQTICETTTYEICLTHRYDGNLSISI